MDTLTHSLVGIALSRVFFKRRVAFATTAMVIACNLPDLDVLYSWPGVRYIEFHRGALHSVWMLPVWGLLVALGLRWVARKKNLPVPPLWMGFALGCAGVGSHLLLDWTNMYGIRLLAPFSQHWFALDWVPILDPWILLILAAFLTGPMMLGLITSEIGAKKKSAHRLSASLALMLVVAWVGVRARQHKEALDILNAPEFSGMYEGQLPYSWSAFPKSSTAFQWQALVDMPRNYLVVDVSAPWDEDFGRARPVRSFIKPPITPAIQAAQRTSTGEAVLDFARYPYSDEEEQGSDAIVSITDMRFAQGPIRPGLHAEIRLNESGRVLSQGLDWTRQ